MTTGMAYNTVFELRSCLYRKSDISAAPGSRLDAIQPIICFDWNSIFVFNHKSRRFESGAETHGACTGE